MSRGLDIVIQLHDSRSESVLETIDSKMSNKVTVLDDNVLHFQTTSDLIVESSYYFTFEIGKALNKTLTFQYL